MQPRQASVEPQRSAAQPWSACQFIAAITIPHIPAQSQSLHMHACKSSTHETCARQGPCCACAWFDWLLELGWVRTAASAIARCLSNRAADRLSRSTRPATAATLSRRRSASACVSCAACTDSCASTPVQFSAIQRWASSIAQNRKAASGIDTSRLGSHLPDAIPCPAPGPDNLRLMTASL